MSIIEWCWATVIVVVLIWGILVTWTDDRPPEKEQDDGE